MIDWSSLAFNAMWVLGASVVLAAFSYHHWLARETGQTLRQVLHGTPWLMSYAVGMTLVCAGWMLAQADRWWERVLWGALAATFAWQVVRVFRGRRTGSS